MKILVIDIGGSHVKALCTGVKRPRRFESGTTLTPAMMVASVQELAKDWSYEAISVGYPGPARDGHPTVEPAHLGSGWVGFDFTTAFGRPVKLVNDAAMQALGGYDGGRMLFLGLGTGLGSALVIEGHLHPLELAHLPYRKKRSFEDYVGERGRLRLGEEKWRRRVIDVVERLRAATQVEQVLLGGGNAQHLRAHLDRLPVGTRIGGNADAFRGGFRMWEQPEDVAKAPARGRRSSRSAGTN